MPTYAEIEDGVVTNRVIWEGHDHSDSDEWVGPLDDMDPEPQIGWLYDGNTFSPPPEEPEEP